ncbi:MAG: autotransporter outer membrane beta-barrel domain-containing protein [Polynucleobacter sp.]
MNKKLLFGLTLLFCGYQASAAVNCSQLGTAGSTLLAGSECVTAPVNPAGTWVAGNLTIGSAGVLGDTTPGSAPALGFPSSTAFSLGDLANSGTIHARTLAVSLVGSSAAAADSVNSITNNVGATITSDLSAGIYINNATLTTLSNFGTIASGNINSYGINLDSTARLLTLNNSQSNLKYYGNLPQNYNIVLGSNASTFGTLKVTSASSWNGATGQTNFGIFSGSVLANKYTAVISGVSSSLFNASSLSGNYTVSGKTYSYQLALETGTSGTTNIWDLLFPGWTPAPTGPDLVNTQQSLANSASALQNIYTLQNSVLANSFTYDCALFDKNNVCISAGGRNTAVSATNGLNNTSALLIAAYRPHPNYRVGAYADQNLSVNNAGSTVSLGNNTPLVGLFGAWNERLDGTGTEVKVTAAYGQKNTTVTRSVVGTGATASEAGAGGSNLNSQGAQVTAKYGFGVAENVIVSPYAGIRYTQNNMGGYTEGSSSSVTAPLTYSALNTNATTALAGVGASYRFIPQATAFASAGVETDTNTAHGSYSATGVTGLTPINFNANPVKTRPTAMVGATYDVEKNQRIGVTGIYRQEPYQAVSTTTVMATYTVGL